MLGKLFDFVFGTLAGKAATFGVGLLGLIIWHKFDVSNERRVARREVVTEIRGNNNAVRGLAEGAGAKSLTGGGGVLNPYYRH